MITVLLWVVVCYGLAAAAVHTASRLNWKRESRVKHFVLIAGNHQMQMEWYMRSLQWYSHRCGKEVRVTVVNQGSEDETMDIARCFARSGMDVRFAGGMPGGEAEEEGILSKGTRVMRKRNDGEDGNLETRNHLSKWQHFRILMKRRRMYRRERNIAASESHGDGRGRNNAETESHDKVRGLDADESTHLYWMTKQGVVTDKEHAVLVDLRDPGDLSKLPL